MINEIRQRIKDSSKTILNLSKEADKIASIAKVIASILKQDGKLLIFGNGGSAAQAQHIAAEFVVRFKKNRTALPAIALTTDTSILTATANDYSFEKIFTRQIEALAKTGDIAVALSTSGNSPNVIQAIEKAKQLNLKTIALLGKDGGKLKGEADHEIIVKSNDVARIQEAHITILHIIAEIVENETLKE